LHFRLVLTALAVALVLAVPAQAAKKTKIAVLDVRAVGTFDPKSIEGLSTLIASELSRSEQVEVTSGSDIRAMIGFDRERQLLGCSETGCLAEIGGALGVDYLRSTAVSQIGGVWLLTLSLLDVGRAKANKRITKRCDAAKDLIDASIQAVSEVMDALHPSSAAVATITRPPPETTGQPPPVEQPPVKPEPVEPTSGQAAVKPDPVEPARGATQTTPARAPSTAVATTQTQAPEAPSNLGSWLMVGGGAAVAAGGAVLLGSAWSTQGTWENSQQAYGLDGVTKSQAETAEWMGRGGVALIGVGGALAGWGLFRVFTSGDAPESPTVPLVPGRDGATVLVTAPISP